jgi:hypothetical protein
MVPLVSRGWNSERCRGLLADDEVSIGTKQCVTYFVTSASGC